MSDEMRRRTESHFAKLDDVRERARRNLASTADWRRGTHWRPLPTMRSPHDECPTCGGCVDAPLVGWPGGWHTPGDDCLLKYCTPCRDECHR